VKTSCKKKKHKKFRILILLTAALILLSASLLQWALDGTPAGVKAERRENFPSAVSFLDFLGGVRQYLAYVLYIKTDTLHHTYYGSLAEEKEIVPYLLLISYLDPHYVDAYYVGSEIIYDQGKREEAFDFLFRGIEANPESADLYSALADLYLREKRYEEAADAFRKALDLEPKIVEKNLLWWGLTAACHAQGKEEEGREVLTEQILYNMVRFRTADLSPTTRARLVHIINNLYNALKEKGWDVEKGG
jgi:tetratricopeptide (TPR) repeat protein